MKKGVLIGAGMMFLIVLVMAANLSDNAIMNAVYDATNQAIQVDVVHDTFSNNVAVGGTLTVTGVTTLNGGVTADSGAFSVADTSGNVATTGTLTVTGATALNGGLTMDSTAFTVANTSGNVATAGTLDVTGATTVAAITASGTASLKGAVVINEDSADVDTRIESNDVSDAFKVDAGANFVQIGAWPVMEYVTTTAQSYSLTSTGRAGNYIQTIGEEASFHLMTALLTSPGAGVVITVKTGGTNDVVIDTEGSETIDGAATYSLNASYEAVTLTTDGSNWFVLSGYGE